MNPDLQSLIRGGNFISDENEYRVIRLVPNAITLAAGILAEISEPFSALIVDVREVTLVIEAEAYEEYQKRLHDHEIAQTSYQLITFDTTLEFDLVGFMAVISQALASVGVSILAYAAYDYDHFLVQTEQFELAMTTLKNLQASL